MLAALSEGAPAMGAAQAGNPIAKVRADSAGPITVSGVLFYDDRIRLCAAGEGFADSVIAWRTPTKSGRDRRTVYVGMGCQYFQHNFSCGPARP
ncbi:hypothetical protein ABFT23_07390 [Nocardioides sp. C4-1]|uniref:hypothetical protein n=1 Tax=Nocardioides sp. C4-1 TaxID=3151851 RepID=UPI003263AB34